MRDASPLLLLLRGLLAAAVAVTLWLPAWWAAGRLPELRGAPFLRLLVAAGGATVAYLTFVNLAGRAVERSTGPASAWIVLNAVAVIALVARRRDVLATRRPRCARSRRRGHPAPRARWSPSRPCWARRSG